MGVVPSHMGDMCVCVCRVRGGQIREAGGRRPPGDNPLALFDKCHGLYSLFYLPAGTQDRWLIVPSEGQLVVHWCSVRRQSDLHTRSWLCCPMAKTAAS